MTNNRTDLGMMKNDKDDRARVLRPPPLHYNLPIGHRPCFWQSSSLKKSKMHFKWAHPNTMGTNKNLTPMFNYRQKYKIITFSFQAEIKPQKVPKAFY